MLDPDALAEKLAPPRPLTLVREALYAPPLAPSRRAWLAWLPHTAEGWLADRGDEALRAVLALAAHHGATSLQYGGPPGNYVTSGAREDDRALVAFLARHGFEARGRHVDLSGVPPRAPRDPRVERVRRADADAVLSWVSATFSPAWAMESERALGHDGLFTARVEGALAGFVAHSGNLAARGTFGPVGVAPEARGHGLGAALTLAALDDLGARGFSRVTIPWVEPGTADFYEKLCGPLERVERQVWVRPW